MRSVRWHCLVASGAVAAAAAVGAARVGSAQPTYAAVGVSGARDSGGATVTPRGQGMVSRLGIPMRDSAWWVPLASAAVPGYGQRLLGQHRFVAYLAVEGYAIANYFASQSAFGRERDRYLSLARDIARAFVPGNQAIGNWDYYEAMEKNLESGVYDRTPGTGTLSPEIDTATFNGKLWLTARRLSEWPNPDVEPDHGSVPYLTAVAYYARRAVLPEYRWSWRNAQLEWDLYRQSIKRGNDASRDARQYLAVVAVNHMLSMVDAFITLRLRGGVGAARGTYSLVGTLPVR